MLHRIRPQYVAHEVHQLMGGVPLRHLQQWVLPALVNMLVAHERVGPKRYPVGMVPGSVLRRPPAMRCDGRLVIARRGAVPIRVCCVIERERERERERA